MTEEKIFLVKTSRKDTCSCVEHLEKVELTKEEIKILALALGVAIFHAKVEKHKRICKTIIKKLEKIWPKEIFI